MAKARWYRDAPEPDNDDIDPFDGFEDTPVAPVCPKTPSNGQLQRELADLVRGEAELDALGVRCPIRDDPESTCLGCPVRRTDPRDPLFGLCEIGVRQEKVLGLLAARRHA